MKNVSVFLMFAAAFLLQSTLFLHLRVFGAAPNLLLCLVVVMAFLYEGNHAILPGIVFGLLQDLCFSPLIGPAAMIYLLLSVLMGYIRIFLYRDSIPSLFFASLIGTVLYQLFSFGIGAIFGGTYTFLHVIMALPALAAYHFIVMLIFYLIVGRRSIRHPQDRYYKSSRFYIE